MPKPFAFAVATITASALCAASASAAITYYVDTGKQQIVFNGSWTGGLPQDMHMEGFPAGYTRVTWGIHDLEDPVVDGRSEQPESGSAYDTEGTTADTLQYFSTETGELPWYGASLWFDIIFSTHSMTPGILTIDNLVFSYHDFSQDIRNYIESIATQQQPMTLRFGTNYGDITYSEASIPDPVIPEASHIGLIFGATAAVLLLRRRLTQARCRTA